MFDKGRAEALSNKPKTSATFKITQRLQLFKITIGMQIYIYASYNLLNLSSRGSLRSSIRLDEAYRSTSWIDKL